MGSEQTKSNMRFILMGDDYSRVYVNTNDKGDILVNLDLHGLSCHSAEKLVRNTININRGAFVLGLIHGYNHGTALKEMIYKTQFNRRVICKSGQAHNPGVTYLKIAA